jgi:phosphonate ABC transporter permease subunit PhnE
VQGKRFACYYADDLSSLKEILAKYPDLKRPGPKYWLIPTIIVMLVILGWNVHDTQLAHVQRNNDGRLTIVFPEFRLDAAKNIVFGIAPKEVRDIYGNNSPMALRRGGLIRPDFTRETLGSLMPDMLVTIEMALLGTLIAFIFAFPMSFLAARNIIGATIPSQSIYYFIRFLFNFLSAIPTLIVALIFTVIMGMGPAAGVLALGFNSIGMLGRMFAEALEEVDRGPIEALQATGAGRIQTVAYGVLPQIGPLFLSYSIYRWDINVRMSMILGFVGAGGIGVFLNQNINLFNYSKVSTAFILILVTVTLLDWGNSWIQRKML